MFRRNFCKALTALSLVGMSTSAFAMTNSELARQSKLKIVNMIDQTETILGLEDFQKLPVTRLQTVTPWTDGMHEFEGVYVKDIAQKYGASSGKGRAVAFNDYQIEFELKDVVEKGGFLAFKRDGEPLSRRDKGPFWVVFPWSERPELDIRSVHGLSIWQLVELSFN